MDNFSSLCVSVQCACTHDVHIEGCFKMIIWVQLPAEGCYVCAYRPDVKGVRISNTKLCDTSSGPCRCLHALKSKVTVITFTLAPFTQCMPPHCRQFFFHGHRTFSSSLQYVFAQHTPYKFPWKLDKKRCCHKESRLSSTNVPKEDQCLTTCNSQKWLHLWYPTC